MKITYTSDLPGSDDFFALFESTGWNKEYRLTREELAGTFKSNYFSVSAYHSGKLIGFGRVISDGILHAMIYEMIVDPEYQGKGVGSGIMNIILKKCLDDRIRDIQLFCAKGKKGFYEKFGFVNRPEDGPGMEFKDRHMTGSILSENDPGSGFSIE